MTRNILDSIENYFTQEFKNTLDNNLDEPGTGVSKAISAIIPTALFAIANRSNADDNGDKNIFNQAKQAAGYYPKEPDVAKLQNDEEGSNLPHDIFGKNEQKIIRHIAAYSGIRPNSVSSLIVLTLPVIMGKLGEWAQQENLSANEFSSALSSFKGDIVRLTPDGYVLPDFSSPIVSTKEDDSKIHDNSLARQANFVIPRWIPIFLIIIVVLVLIYFSRM